MDFGRQKERVFKLSGGSLEEASGMFGAVAGMVFLEGAKSLRARQLLGLPMPLFAGRPLDGFLKVSFADEAGMNAIAAYVARRAGLGTYWLGKDLHLAPDVFRMDDDDAAAFFQYLIRAGAEFHMEGV